MSGMNYMGSGDRHPFEKRAGFERSYHHQKGTTTYPCI